MAVQETPSAGSPRCHDANDPATLVVRRVSRLVENQPLEDRPTHLTPPNHHPKTPQPREAPPLGSHYPVITGYEIVRQLGRGGMGVVYLAREIALNRWVALKVVVGGVFAGDEAFERFHREAEAVAALQHPNIVQIFNVGVSNANVDGPGTCPYIALEYADGGNLAAHTGKPLPPRVAAELVATLAEAIQYAHSRGIVHRDLKPGNVLMRVDAQADIGEDGLLSQLIPKVTDFGLAKRVNGDGTAQQESTTVAGSTLGTPEYMAPEQAQGDRCIGPAADIYSLGVILFELLTARVPLQGADALDTLVRVRTQEAPAPSRLQARLPKDLDTICLRCLQKDPAKRYKTAQHLADDLHSWLEGKPIAARPIGAVERLWKWAQRRPMVAALLAMVLLVAWAGFAGVFWQWQRAEARATSELAALQRASQALQEAQNNLYFGRIAVAQRELGMGNPWDATRLLDLCRPNESDRDLRSWEWHYLNNASRGELLSFQASEEWVWDVAFSPDGTQLATAAGTPFHGERDHQPGELCLWDAKTGTLIRKLEGHSATIYRVAYSPDGKYLCSGDESRSLRIWDLASGEEVCPPQVCYIGDRHSPINFGDAGPFWFTADSRSVQYLGQDEIWRQVDIASGKVITVPDLAGVETQSTNGRFRLRLRDQRTVEVIEAATNQRHKSITHPRHYNRFAVSGDGTRVLMSNDDHLELFETSSDMRQRVFDLDGSWIETIAFSNDGKTIAAAGSSRTVYVWNDAVHQSVMYSGHNAEVRRVAFSADGRRLASCDRAGKVFVWDLARNPMQQLIHSGTDCSSVWATGISPDGRSIKAAFPGGNIIHLCRDSRRKREVRINGLTETVQYPRYDVSFSPNAEFVVGPDKTDPSILRQWNTETGDLIRVYRGHGRSIMGTAWSHDGRRLATRAIDRKDQNYVTEVWVWDTQTGEKINAVTTTPIMGMALSSDGRFLGGATRRGEVIVWEVDSGREVWRGIGHRPADYDGRSAVLIFNVAFSPDDAHFATVGFWDGKVQLWKADTGEKLHDPLPARSTLTGVAFSPDSKRVAAVGYDSEVRIWDVSSGRSALTLRAPTGSRRGDTAFTARPIFSLINQQLVVLDWSGTIVVWDGQVKNE